MSKSKNTATDTPSISNVERLKELEKARLWASETPCMLEFIDCGNLADLDGCDMSLNKEQMNGVFLLLDGVLANLEGISVSVIAGECKTEERTVEAIHRYCDDARNIILLAVKLAKVRLAEEENNEESVSDVVCMNEIWVAGFLASLRFANEIYVSSIYECVRKLIEAIPVPSEGGGNAHDSLH
ncbi:MAG: hypothetical protein JSR51_02355 [Proteobacteria bacterium]|nr:hypothetical protein [Pseudomonadota bacterium]